MSSENLTSTEPITTIRGFIWNYPVFIHNFLIKTRPISHMAIYFLLAILLFRFALTDDVFTYFKHTKENTLSEATIGSVQYLNPVFDTRNPVDNDLRDLIFQRFIRIDQNGEPQASVAESWEVLDEGKRYEFKIKDDLYWQDGKKLTAKDVWFTFDTIMKFDEETGFDSVGRELQDIKVEAPDSKTVVFTLQEVNSTFFESASIHIIPHHILKSEKLKDYGSLDFDEAPIGSGPYKFVEEKNKQITLVRSDYYPVKPKIQKINYMTFGDISSLTDAFRSGYIDTITNVPLDQLKFLDEYKGYKALTTNMKYRNKIIYINNRREPLNDSLVRKGMSYATDREKIIRELDITAKPSLGPISESSWAFNTDITPYKYNPSLAKDAFEEAGYTKSSIQKYYKNADGKELEFNLIYLDTSSNKQIAKEIQETWEKNGIKITLSPKSYEQITKEILATRDFDLLLYEVQTTIDPDQYNLWHSLKTNYPDLNLAGYEYKRVDILLERARHSLSRADRKKDYNQFQKYINDDAPVIFLYHPQYVYIVPTDLKGVNLDKVNYPEDRFYNIQKWSF